MYLTVRYNLFCAQERVSEESKESESFKSLLHARTQEFVEEVSSPTTHYLPSSPSSHSHSLSHFLNTHTHIHTQVLSPYFGGMIGFVKDVEPLLERGQRDKIRVDEREPLARIAC